METDGQYARPAFGSHPVEPVEGVPAIAEEFLGGAEVAAVPCPAPLAISKGRSGRLMSRDRQRASCERL